MDERAVMKRVMFAEHYGMGPAEAKKYFRSLPPVEARCDNCIYYVVNQCPDCAGTNRRPIPREEVINCR